MDIISCFRLGQALRHGDTDSFLAAYDSLLDSLDPSAGIQLTTAKECARQISELPDDDFAVLQSSVSTCEVSISTEEAVVIQLQSLLEELACGDGEGGVTTTELHGDNVIELHSDGSPNPTSNQCDEKQTSSGDILQDHPPQDQTISTPQCTAVDSSTASIQGPQCTAVDSSTASIQGPQCTAVDSSTASIQGPQCTAVDSSTASIQGPQCTAVDSSTASIQGPQCTAVDSSTASIQGPQCTAVDSSTASIQGPQCTAVDSSTASSSVEGLCRENISREGYTIVRRRRNKQSKSVCPPNVYQSQPSKRGRGGHKNNYNGRQNDSRHGYTSGYCGNKERHVRGRRERGSMAECTSYNHAEVVSFLLQGWQSAQRELLTSTH
ncbi:serine-rich adhesin for platelets-like [Halichondria panicea]|uniref:serine-rich adhesin for platelets-like n=1 Tax=Halichondria panicea TaxID=6063 RepID=UPI00312B4EB9